MISLFYRHCVGNRFWKKSVWPKRKQQLVQMWLVTLVHLECEYFVCQTSFILIRCVNILAFIYKWPRSNLNDLLVLFWHAVFFGAIYKYCDQNRNKLMNEYIWHMIFMAMVQYFCKWQTGFSLLINRKSKESSYTLSGLRWYQNYAAVLQKKRHASIKLL